MAATKVLVVEDKKSNNQSLTAILEKLKFEITASVSKIEKVFFLLKETDFDIILIDLEKIKKDQVTKALNYIWSNLKIPIILLTHTSGKAIIISEKFSYLLSFLNKPYNERELRLTIELALFAAQSEKCKMGLNSLFGTARKIDQIINTTDENKKLIKEICRSFVNSSEFKAAYIVLVKQSNNLIHAAQAGFKSTKVITDVINNVEFSPWLNKVLLNDDIIDIENSSDLIFPFLKSNQQSLNIRLESAGKIYGFLSLIFNKRKLSKEEKELIKSIAADIGFSLHNIEIKQKDKNIEDILARSEAKYRMVIENATDIIFTTNETGDFKFVNNAGLLNTGFTNDEILKLNYLALILPEYKKTVQDFYKVQIESGKTSAYIEYPFRSKNGEIKWYGQNSTLMLDNHTFKGFHCISRDITERKQIEAELRKRQSEVTTLIDNLPGFAFLKDINGKYIIANKNFCNAMGIPKEKLIGKKDFELLSKEQAEQYYSDDLKVIKSGRMQYVLEEKTLIDNKYLTIGTRKVPLKDENGNVFGLIGLGFDITEQKEAEEAIKKYTKELEELNANKDKFFSIISHDLRSPFQGLLGLSSALVDEYDNMSEDEIHMFMESINVTAKNLYNLIENLLQWSRAQKSNIEMNLTKLELHDEIEYTINLLQNNAANKNIQIINITSKGMFVNSDANILNSTLQNLLSNAIKFTKPHGMIFVSALKKDEFVELIVKDTGIGISEEDLKNLFRIDKRHSTPGTEMEMGTGLGLIICKELIELQGGTIRVKSQLGKGTEFTITLQSF